MGGGGGGGDSAAAARQQEAQRQAAIQQRQGVIDSVFSDPSRQQVYDNIGADTVNAGMYKLDLEKGDADRTLMFNLARRGLGGSSVDADQRGRLAKNYLDNTLTIKNRGEQAKNDLRLKDANEKSRLYSMSVSGGDPASLAQQATQAMQANAAASSSEAYLNNIGSLLGNVSLGLNDGLNTPGSGTSQLAKRIGTYFGGSSSGNSGKVTSIGGG